MRYWDRTTREAPAYERGRVGTTWRPSVLPLVERSELFADQSEELEDRDLLPGPTFTRLPDSDPVDNTRDSS